MKDRGERRFKKEQIKAELRKKIEERLFQQEVRDVNGPPQYRKYNRTREQLEARFYSNEGKKDQPTHPCGDGYCSWCASNLTYQGQRVDQAALEEQRAWEAGELNDWFSDPD